VGESGPCSSTSEYRLALFNKGAARFAVIFRLTTMDVVGSLEVETIVHVSVHGAVQILLHVAIGHCGTRSQAARDFVGARSQILWSAYPINKSEAQRLLGADALREYTARALSRHRQAAS
jgi:hypothetical protein